MNEGINDSAKFSSDINQSIYLLLRSRKRKFTHRNIKRLLLGVTKRHKSWKNHLLSNRRQTMQETEEVWLSVLGLRIIFTFHQGETTERNERLQGRVLGTKGKGWRGILHRSISIKSS